MYVYLLNVFYKTRLILIIRYDDYMNYRQSEKESGRNEKKVLKNFFYTF